MANFFRVLAVVPRKLYTHPERVEFEEWLARSDLSLENLTWNGRDISTVTAERKAGRMAFDSELSS